ncbi:MAG: alpha/beta fold hydrolase [bacterium]|nr:alpha/beta fold hydrolase [bacterium]
MKEDVQFYSEGSLVKGILYTPGESGEDGKVPAIVLCHGFAGVKELLLPAYAEAFSRGGYMVLTFDYRGFGESEGEPGKLSPQAQVTDIRNALSFMQSLPRVDAERLGLWGTSFGGANAVVASALDKRVKCLAVQLTFEDGERVITGGLTQEEKDKLYATLTKIAVKAATRNQVMKLPINKILTDEQSIEFYNKYKDSFQALNIKIPFLTIRETIEHKPGRYLDSVHVPLLIVAAENDKVNPREESEILYKKANEPKSLHIVAGATHYQVYEGEKFREVASKQLEWFGKHL